MAARGLKNIVKGLAAVVPAGAGLAASSAHAASAGAAALHPFALTIAAFTVVVFFWAGAAVRKLTRSQSRMRQRIAHLETELNETEATLAAEPHIMFVWRGREGQPERISGDMRGAAKVPKQNSELKDFAFWLEPESAGILLKSVQTMRESGAPFNIGVKTRSDELLEADGRCAGGLATLRLRPLAGERRNAAKLAYDMHKMTGQLQQLSAILDRAPVPVWLRGAAGELVWANRAYITAIEVDGIDDALRAARPLVDEATVDYRSAPELGGAIQRGHTHTVIAGANRAMEVFSIDLGEGRAGFAIDRTSAEEAEKELKRHVRAQAAMLDRLTSAIAIFGPDRRLKFHNRAYSELWALEPAWLDTAPLHSEILDHLRAERRLPEQSNYRAWRNDQFAAYTTLEPSESWWHLPDGRSLRVVYEQHPFGGVVHVYENITEKIKLESRYNELIGVQRETLDNMHEGVALFGPDGCLRLYNPSYVRFWDLDAGFLDSHPHVDRVIERCGKHLRDQVMWDELKFCVTELSDERQPLQGRITRPDGMVFDHAAVPLPDGNTLITYVDMTASAGIERALRERNEALETADRIKTDILSNFSYELRTPLTSIIGFTETLTLGMKGELTPEQLESLRHIQNSSGDLLAIIDAILDLTTIDSGTMELDIGRIDTADIMAESIRPLRALIDERNLTVKIELTPGAESFAGDARRVRQVLHNLLANAVGFSEDGAVVRMGARRCGDHLELWVADTGKGMDTDFQATAFERFQSRPAAARHRGPGLGLSIVKSFVELHGGTVSLCSRAGHGTTVVCRVPVAGPYPCAPDVPVERQSLAG